MKKNMGNIDRIIRGLVVLLIVILFLTGQLSGLAAVILGVIAVIFFVTGLISVCPLYIPFKISTLAKKAK